VFEEKYDNNTDIQKFTAPNVREGSIIEVTYRINSEFLSNFRDWEFQSTIPIVWSEYRAEIPEYFNYERYTQGYIMLAVNESSSKPNSIIINSKERSEGKINTTTFSQDKIDYQTKAFRWVAKDVPAFKNEPFMTTQADYISKINFELANYKMPNGPLKQIMGTWEDLNKSFLESENFGLAVKGSLFLKKTTEEVTAGLVTPQEKSAAIYNYVKANMVWDGRNRKFLDDNLRKALDAKKGSSAEINLLLVSMLQKADIIANPVILSTRNNGFIRENVAVSSQFNYVICQVVLDGKNILLDATDKMLPMTLLPEKCLNGKGYVISKETPGWISLTSSKSKVYASSDVTFNKDGQLTGKMNIFRDGYFGYKMRNDYSKKGEEEYVKDFTNNMSWTVDKSEFKNLKDLNVGAEENHVFTHNDSFSNGDIIYLNPLLYLHMDENPFKLEARTYPVDFGSASDQTFICKLTIPENYVAEEVPVSKVIALPNNTAKYVYNVQVAGNTVNITSMLSINKGLFLQSEYPYLREFYNQVIAKQAEQIVLKKKN
ncbi:MAG TPA: transglutaminase-like domain-containing protein, partial [Cyclobacteriaceae bacterium]|nr:transglutaminase-like domain-containing protein [Cyclobacteriaceae bacterium]